MSKKALVIDGNSLIYRAFYATGNQLAYYKQHNLPPVNALKLVMQIVLKLISQTQYDYVLMALDHEKKTLRHEVFEHYKAGRKPMPTDLFLQLTLIKEAMHIMGISTLSLPGIEADDIIGSFAKLMNDHDVDVEIYSSDKDLLQLVNDRTIVNLFKTGISDIHKININNFSEFFFGLLPSQVCDFKGISGDSSDNLLGVKGVGPKTAVELIKKYGSLEGIYQSIDKLNVSQQIKFNESKAVAIMCKQLSTIQMNVLSNYRIDDFVKKPINHEKFKFLINQYHFTGFEKYQLHKQTDIFSK
ncbi:MAG: 5'-3' exonuclease [Mycoplasmataceae bacterium]|jgi:DNA polymerase-1|nr:5'-3' exonuclease [Mycoplasmataceae bacterium]